MNYFLSVLLMIGMAGAQEKPSCIMQGSDGKCAFYAKSSDDCRNISDDGNGHTAATCTAKDGTVTEWKNGKPAPKPVARKKVKRTPLGIGSPGDTGMASPGEMNVGNIVYWEDGEWKKLPGDIPAQNVIKISAPDPNDKTYVCVWQSGVDWKCESWHSHHKVWHEKHPQPEAVR